jgi:hypothetical protein
MHFVEPPVIGEILTWKRHGGEAELKDLSECGHKIHLQLPILHALMGKKRPPPPRWESLVSQSVYEHSGGYRYSD